MRSRSGNRRSPIADLDVTAFINLMVVLVSFFLSSVTYFQLSSLELKIPPSAPATANPDENLALEVIIRKDALEVGDRNKGLLRRFDNVGGAYDYKNLNQFLQQVKGRFPDKTEATLLSEADIPYEVLIGTMDAVRSFIATDAGKRVQAELFPDISIGDAPAPAKATP
jgi:biopolymer transport protein ExbD